MADAPCSPTVDVPRVAIDRQAAIRTLNSVALPSNHELSAHTWPIGAAMLQFPSETPDGRTVRDAGPDYWHRQLTRIKREGFASFELPSAWLPIGEMSAAENETLTAVIEEVGLKVIATSVVRQSIIDPTAAGENLAATHRAIDAAAAIGSPLICLGLHEALFPAQTAIPWFWTVQGPTNPDDREEWDRAVRLYQELSSHAADVGVLISLELYEGTYLGECDSAVAFITDIDRDNVGLNPDLGNLIRAQSPIEPWEAMAVKTLPLSNYWHVKNYTRAEDPNSGTYLTTPTSLQAGLIDYRMAVRFAIASGYRGAFLAENYGGDGLAVSADNARYLRHVLDDILTTTNA